MKREDRILRIGTMTIAAAIILRLFSGSLGTLVTQALGDSGTASVLLFLGTGRIPGPLPEPPQTVPAATQGAESVEPTAPEELTAAAEPAPPQQQVSFGAQDETFVQVGNFCGYPVDIPALLQTPLAWDLTGSEPSVLILHTHTSESYEKTENYEETAKYRTLDEGYNMVSIGDALTELLTQAGIGVIHDRSMHDYPSYNNAYSHARKTIDEYLAEYPSIRLVLDLHRDAMEDTQGRQLAVTADISGQQMARLMLVVGTDAGGLHHPGWQENLSMAVKLQAQIEKRYPGLCRPLAFRSQRYNQDMCPGAVLIEVGTAGNTRQQALAAMAPLAQSIASLAKGSQGGSS